MPAHTRTKVLLLLLITFNVLVDQWSKDAVRTHVAPDSYTELAGPALILTRVENTGAFLGMGQDWNPLAKRVFLQGLPLALMLFLMYRLLRQPGDNRTMAIGLSCIIGGGLGNLWDRFYLGSVTDFFQMRAGPLHTGIFNMADVSVSLGLVLVLLAYGAQRKKQNS
ncbi:signal peptidase II [Robiginitalea sp. M366]|uniref:signal peptidase II n=1 Tax=Robiginitalea aestuariiviva TaxID=3036903 RepID=UPI00240D04CD|nr:signal peptidase II [Robiginitalea aestuariiviva]MDG1573089.1 signal peptidase II [Robiginitalea aestuariiviva]